MAHRYTISNTFTLANNASLVFLGITGTTATSFNPISVDSDHPNLIVELFENPTTTANGTSVTPVSTNRNNTKTSTVAVFSAPTTTANGTQIFKFAVIGNKQGSIASEFDTVFNLKTETKYLYKITNTSGQSANLSVVLTWDELTQYN